MAAVPNIPALAAAAASIKRWLEWEEESLELFHAYAQRYGCPGGANVYLFVLEDALKTRGRTLEQFKAGMSK